MRIGDPDDGSGTTGGGGGGGSTGGGGVTWIANGTSDTIHFTSAPANGAVIVVNELAAGVQKSSGLWSLGAWCDAFGYPGEVEFYSARLWWASSRDQPQSVWASGIEAYSTFRVSTPIQDDDAITARIASRTLQECRDLVPMQSLIILATGGAWKVTGGDSEVVTPANITFKSQVAEPASHLPALMVGSSAIYATENTFQVRDLSFAFEADGYVGNDLTAFCSHLTKFHQLTDWDYAPNPYSTVLSCRDDGVMLSMTYKKEHQVVGWARMTTRGRIGSVACIPESTKSGTYIAVMRWIGGTWKACIERQAMPTVNVVDWVGLDCSLTFDGRNKTATTLTLSGAGWTPSDILTVTASASVFALSHVGDFVTFGYGADDFARLEVVEYVSATVVKVTAQTAVASKWQGVGTVDWALSANVLTGLDHLNGETVDVVGDGMILSQAVVVGGSTTIERSSTVVHVGYAYNCDAVTLEPNLAGEQTIQGRKKLIRRVDLQFENARNVQVGMDFDKLEPMKSREREDMSLAPSWKQNVQTFNISCDWTDTGRICIRAGGGLPATLLAATPHVTVGQ